MMLRTLAAAAGLALAGSALAQTGELYIFNNGDNQTWVIQGGQVVRTFSRGSSNESAGAVAGDIRTYGNNGGATGRQYDLNGSQLGPTYTNNINVGTFYDATTDGQNYNYTAGYSGTPGQMWRFDRDWQNGQVLFQTGDSNLLGVTYDTARGTLWSIIWPSQMVEYDLNGNLLAGPFNVGPGSVAAIAYDPADDSLWTIENGSSGNIAQYNKQGQLIQQLNIPNYNASNPLGAEFAIPSPGAVALLGLGGAVAARRRRA